MSSPAPPFGWPTGFPRWRDEAWTSAPVSTLAQKYDSVERHGWYANLDPTVDELTRDLRDGDVLVDYSGGTGILADRLLRALDGRRVGIVEVDASPKFLRLALDKLRSDERVAFRLLNYRKEEKRLEYLDEVVPEFEGRVASIVSANAIHLYYDLPGTLRAWRRALRPGGRTLAQSGNVRNPEATGWIIDDTVTALAEEARALVREEPAFAKYRGALEDVNLMAAHDAYRKKVFVPPRPLQLYLDAFRDAGLRLRAMRVKNVTARTDEWLEFLQVYDDAVLGWVGGIERIEGHDASPDAKRDRLEIMKRALERVMQGRDTFDASWTYLTFESS